MVTASNMNRTYSQYVKRYVLRLWWKFKKKSGSEKRLAIQIQIAMGSESS